MVYHTVSRGFVVRIGADDVSVPEKGVRGLAAGAPYIRGAQGRRITNTPELQEAACRLLARDWKAEARRELACLNRYAMGG